jgi:hypothetical protein
MDGTDAFQAEVMAYAAITVIRRGHHPLTRIARRPALNAASLVPLVQAMLGDGPRSDLRVEEVEHAVRGSEPWLLDAADQLRLLRRLEQDFPELEDADCKVGIGVATGADKIFIGDFESLPVEPDAQAAAAHGGGPPRGQDRWGGKGIINPFEADGSPRLARALPAVRRVHPGEPRGAGSSPRRPEERIGRLVPHDRPRLRRADGYVEAAHPRHQGRADGRVHDEGQFYPHHNLYHVTSSTWDLRALATVLRSSIAVMFVSSLLREDVGRLPAVPGAVPPPDPDPALERRDGGAARGAPIAASPTDLAAIDRVTFAIYGLTDIEAEVVRRVATDARVKRKDS